MKAKQLLENINFLKAKRDIYKNSNKSCPDLEKIITLFGVCKEALSDRQKKVLELHYLEELTIIDTATEIGWSKTTVSRDIEEIKNRLNNLLNDVDLDPYLYKTG